MCIAYPMKITEKGGKNLAFAELNGGVTMNIDISLIDADIGDYVLVHAGYALQKMSEKDAVEMAEIFGCL